MSQDGFPRIDTSSPLTRQLKSLWVVSGGQLCDLGRPTDARGSTFFNTTSISSSMVSPRFGGSVSNPSAAGFTYNKWKYDRGEYFPITGNWSCAGWVYPVNVSGLQYIYTVGDVGSGNLNGMSINTTYVRFAPRYSGGSTVASDLTWTPVNNRWLFVAGVWRSGVSATTYANYTRLVTTTAQTGNAATSGTDEGQLLGGDLSDPGVGGFPGLIANWGLWNRELSHEEIGQYRDATGPHGEYEGLIERPEPLSVAMIGIQLLKPRNHCRASTRVGTGA